MLVIALTLFIFGSIVGSFVNVVIYRTIEGESWVTGRSRCDRCKKQIAWYDNIPLLSYVVLNGKCRYCRKPISIQHPVIELMTGMLFVWWYAVGFAFFRLTQAPLTYVQPLVWLLIGLFLLIIFVTDWLYQIIPDYAVIALVLLSLGYRLFLSLTGTMQWRDFGWSLVMGLVMMGLLGGIWLLTKGMGMGFGDVKFAFVMGLLLGWPRSLVAMFLAFLLGAVVGLVLIGFKVKSFKQKIAFGPFLVLGTALALVWGETLWRWYTGLL